MDFCIRLIKIEHQVRRFIHSFLFNSFISFPNYKMRTLPKRRPQCHRVRLSNPRDKGLVGGRWHPTEHSCLTVQAGQPPGLHQHAFSSSVCSPDPLRGPTGWPAGSLASIQTSEFPACSARLAQAKTQLPDPRRIVLPRAQEIFLISDYSLFLVASCSSVGATYISLNLGENTNQMCLAA